MRDLNSIRGVHLIQIQGINFVDDFEIEIELHKQRLTQTEIGCIWEQLVLSEVKECEFGVLYKEQIEKANSFFRDLCALVV